MGIAGFELYMVAAVPLVFVLVFVASRCINTKEKLQKDTPNTRWGLSGLLTALAILIPIGATFLPAGPFTWRGWLLVGALLTGVLSLSCTIASMIILQGEKTFVPNAHLNVLGSINSTWITLALLSLALIVVKTSSAVGPRGAETPRGAAQLRVAVAHPLPDLGTSPPVIKTPSGTPYQESEHRLLYLTKDGV